MSKLAGGHSRLIAHSDDGNFLPIWSCSVWGLPCPRHYCRGGALLPHLFTLTPASLQGLCYLHLEQSEGSGRAARIVRVYLRTNQSRARHASSQSPCNDAEAVYFLWHFPSSFPLQISQKAAKFRMGHPPGRYPAHCSAEFGLSSPASEEAKAAVRSGCLRNDYMRCRADFGPRSSAFRL